MLKITSTNRSIVIFTIAVQNFALIPQHTSPEVAPQEIDALHDVVLETKKHWNTNVHNKSTHHRDCHRIIQTV